MKGKSTAAIVRCVTCNGGDVELVGYSHVTGDARQLRVQMHCQADRCPAPKFELVFKQFTGRTIMDVEMTP